MFIVTALLASGLFWTLTYVLIIVRGFQDRTYGMPLLALCANISWEFIFAFVLPQPRPQVYVNYVWFGLDCIILFQLLKYWRSDPPIPTVTSKWFYPLFGVILAATFSGVLLLSLELQDREGKYAAYGQNLLMSVLFVTMLLRRQGLAGQSFWIALFKLLGTLIPSIAFFIQRPQALLFDFLYAAILVFDVIYLAAVYRMNSSNRKK
ncbi:MAG: hypothetical protein HY741_22550 [Chloroflexi bacterium]|nr:hypothetical protein [Chloroflexota bacterium]